MAWISSGRLVVVLLAVFLVVDYPAGDAAAQIRTTPPPGFDVLTEPQTSLVDVYFGDALVGEALATFEPGVIELADPASVVDLVPAVLPERRPEVIAALRGRLPTNSGLSCLPQSFPGCGVLDVEVAGVIFNADFFRLDVVIAAEYLATIDARGDRYLADPVTGTGLVSNLTAGVAGSRDREQSFSVAALNRVSRGRSALRADAFLTDRSDESIVEILAAEYHGQDHFLQGGFIDDRTTRFGDIRALLGVGAETNLRSRTDLSAASGTPIPVFLPQRSQVEILRDGRLLSVGSYEAGNQLIDTRSLPRGAYDVTLRIRGPGGEVREEQVFFVKDLALPPAGELVYFAEAGVTADIESDGLVPEPQSTPIIKAGLARRILDQVSGEVSISTTDEIALGEASFRFLAPNLDAGLAFGVTNEGDLGIGGNLGFSYGSFGVSFNADLVESDRDEESDREFSPLDSSRRSVSSSLSYLFENDARFSFRAFYRDGRVDESWAYGPSLTVPVYRNRSIAVDLNTEIVIADDEELAFGRLRFRFNPVFSPYRMEADAGIRYRRADVEGEEDGLEPFGRVGAFRTFDEFFGGDLQAGLEAERDVDAENRVIASADARSAFGTFRGALEYEDDRGGDDLLYRGFAGTTVAANSDGIAFGGRQQADAAILALFDGPPSAGRFLVSAGGGRSTTLPAGRLGVIPLSPYQTYDPRGGTADQQIVDLRQTITRVPLYPGNVATVRWSVRDLISLYGRVVRLDGTPIANARILDVVGLAATDSLGYFVMEVEDYGRFTVQPRDGAGDCQIEISAPQAAENDVISVGDVVCR